MPKTAGEYRLMPRARQDMRGIWSYTAKQWSLQQADRYTDQLADRCQELAAHPERGKAIDEIGAGYRLGLAGRHAIYYRMTDYGIAVIRILHQRMSATLHL